MRLNFLARILVLLFKILWPRALLCFATADFSGWCSPCLDGSSGLSGIHFPSLAGLEIWDPDRLRRDVVFPNFFCVVGQGLDVCFDSTLLMLLKVFWTKGRYVMAMFLGCLIGCGGYRIHSVSCGLNPLLRKMDWSVYRSAWRLSCHRQRCPFVPRWTSLRFRKMSWDAILRLRTDSCG